MRSAPMAPYDAPMSLVRPTPRRGTWSRGKRHSGSPSPRPTTDAATGVPIFSIHTVVLLLAAGAFARYVGAGSEADASAVESSAGTTAAGVLSVVLAIGLLARRGILVRTWQLFITDPPYLLWIGLTFAGTLSFVVAENDGATGFLGLMRMLSGFAIGLSGVALLGLPGFLSALRNAALVVCASSAVLQFASPTMVRAGYLKNIWAGVLGWNSAVGITAGLLIILTIPRLATAGGLTGGKLVQAWVELLLGGYVLFMSASRSAQMACLVALVAYRAQSIRSSTARVMAFALIAAVGIAVVAATGDLLLSELGKDSSFSGRDDIWGLGWHGVLENPLVGYGPGNFWRTDEAVSTFAAQLRVVNAAHNGPLEIALAGGLVSAIAVGLLVVRGLRRGSESSGQPRVVVSLAVPLIVFILALSTSLSLLARNGVIPALFAALTLPAGLLTPRRGRSGA